jgi:hypothetical protein
MRSAFGRDELLLIRGTGFRFGSKANADERAAVASLWRALVVTCSKIAELGRDVALA